MRVTWDGRELHGWQRKAGIAFLIITLPITATLIALALLFSLLILPFGMGVRLVTGKWPSWCKIEYKTEEHQ